VCPFKADHDFILCTLGNKGELSQNLTINATETLAFILKERGARCNMPAYKQFMALAG
jgi:hypothetical protein